MNFFELLIFKKKLIIINKLIFLFIFILITLEIYLEIIKYFKNYII